MLWQAVQPDACDTTFDAASTIRGELFFFKSRYVWRLRAGKLQDGYPALASRHWQGIPSSVDATFEDPLGNIWFFQGKSWTTIRWLRNASQLAVVRTQQVPGRINLLEILNNPAILIICFLTYLNFLSGIEEARENEGSLLF